MVSTDRECPVSSKDDAMIGLRGHFQNAYVTHDLDRAVDLVASRFGLGEFTRFEVELPLRTPDGPGTAVVRVATAWVDRLQVELVEPVSGHVDLYRQCLPEDRDDPTPRFHHVGVRRESEEAMRREVERLGLPFVFACSGAGMDCIFVDARACLGHHLELVSARPETWEMLGWPGD